MITVRLVILSFALVDQGSVRLFDGGYDIRCPNFIIPRVYYRIVECSPLLQESLCYRFEPSYPTL